jgi:hypothetical protein
MEFEFSFRRLLLLAACLAFFAIDGGFTPPQMTGSLHGAAQTQRAWLYCVILFVVGAVSVSVVDHTIGHMDPIHLRPAYILIGVVLMVASVVWLRSLKEALGPFG